MSTLDNQDKKKDSVKPCKVLCHCAHCKEIRDRAKKAVEQGDKLIINVSSDMEMCAMEWMVKEGIPAIRECIEKHDN